MPKVRSKAGYTVVLINEAGKSHQIELSPFGLRLGVTVSLGMVILLAAGFIWVGGVVSPNRSSSHDEALAEKVRSLQAELQKKELAFTLQEKHLKEMQETPTLAAAPPGGSSGVGSGKAPASPVKEDLRENSPLTGVQESFRPQSPLKSLEDDVEESVTRPEFGPKPGMGAAGPKAELQIPFPGEAATGAKNVMNFDAQEAAATVDTPNNGVLSFRLIKDQRETMFSGYLFVIVEMTDPPR